jgi:hypothetical protein
METPVLFLIFNRPDLTEQVFATIREAKPAKLFVAADGARENKEGEAELCIQTRSVVLDHIDWDCEVHTLLRDKNLGCKVAVSSAINWFFDNVEEGIVLEDDTLPSQSFFTFCEEMLSKYRDSEEVTSICALNFLGEYSNGTDSYFFSKIIGIWGWASWKRVWKNYDVGIDSWKYNKTKKVISDHLGEKQWYKQFYPIFETMYAGKFDTWDFQWIYTQILMGGMSIIPSTNLIKNLGFGVNASHTNNADSPLALLKIDSIAFPIKHPTIVQADKYYDTYYFSKYVPMPESLFNKNSIRVKRKLKSAVKKIIVSFKERS